MSVAVGDLYRWSGGHEFVITKVKGSRATVRKTDGSFEEDYELEMFDRPYWTDHKASGFYNAYGQPVEIEKATAILEQDVVNHPTHYKFDNGVEVIDLTEQLNFNCGNVVKYTARAGRKDASKQLEDLRKAEFYIKREIARVEKLGEDL